MEPVIVPKKRMVVVVDKLAGKRVAFVGKFGEGDHERSDAQYLATDEGATLVEDPLADPIDLLVVGDGVGGKPPAEAAKVQAKHPQVQTLDAVGFYRFLHPNAEEMVELMCSGPRGHGYWSRMKTRAERAGVVLDLSGTDFRKRTVETELGRMALLDGCDFRGANISVVFKEVKGANFEGAVLNGGEVSKAEDCNFRKATLNKVWVYSGKFVRCDFTGARVSLRIGGRLTMEDCIFREADLHDVYLRGLRFAGADFRGANFAGADLEECDFTGADLSGADFRTAKLQNAVFAKADLRNAKLHGTILAGAKFAGALLDGADFADANTTDLELDGVDVSQAKNLAVKTLRPPGPHLLELGKVAAASSRLWTSIELRLGPEEHVVVDVHCADNGNGRYAGFHYVHAAPKRTGVERDAPLGHDSGHGGAATLESAMIKAVDMWPQGTAEFRTVVVEAKKCPRRGRALQNLVIAAWYEACGLQPPPAEQCAADVDDLHRTMLAELHGGAAGVRRWNARSERERKTLSPLRKHDFSYAKLAGAVLKGLDLTGSSFVGADLRKADLWYTTLKGADFAGADLRETDFRNCKPADASFVGADLRQGSLRGVSLLRCNFQQAKLEEADLCHADLRSADFRNTSFAEARFSDAKFDETTRFPADSRPDERLVWKGSGRPPRLAPPPPTFKPGSLPHFDQFVSWLPSHVERPRLEKIGEMLKGERFQLFADVEEEHLVGIARCPSSAEALHCSWLAADGRFGCCTQNLRPCTGSKGALCRHLLTLIVGVVQAKRIDGATVYYWIELSRKQKPSFDAEEMSATFLRYVGATAGKIDWQPTETTPKDFLWL